MASPAIKFIESLLIVSEKAASIARICREENSLFKLLVEEKKSLSKKRDFKTLADVLIQEMIRHELEQKFPELSCNIFGEETNEFTNTHGESVILIVDGDKKNTEKLLRQVLEGYEEAACILAEQVHGEISIDQVPVHMLPINIPDLNLRDIAIWIDPIDATHEYIHGGLMKTAGICFTGLNCVSVLIGAFSKSTGQALIGVINQPFDSFSDNSRNLGRCFWGVCLDNFKVASVPSIKHEQRKPLIAVSVSETSENVAKLNKAGFKLISPSGAGYKALCVILGLVDACVLSFGSTFFWDTCGCHAIIKGLGGNIWKAQESLARGDLVELKYAVKDNMTANPNHYLNASGLIVCKNDELSRKILNALK